MSEVATKTSQLQIRVTPREKAALKELAAIAGQSISAYVLEAALPARNDLQDSVTAMRDRRHRSQALARLRRELRALPTGSFDRAVAAVQIEGLSSVAANMVAGAAEEEAQRRGLSRPEWAGSLAPLAKPHFGSDLRSLRPHLLRVTPAAYKRRNVFIPMPGDPRQ